MHQLGSTNLGPTCAEENVPKREPITRRVRCLIGGAAIAAVILFVGLVVFFPTPGGGGSRVVDTYLAHPPGRVTGGSPAATALQFATLGWKPAAAVLVDRAARPLQSRFLLPHARKAPSCSSMRYLRRIGSPRLHGSEALASTLWADRTRSASDTRAAGRDAHLGSHRCRRYLQ